MNSLSIIAHRHRLVAEELRRLANDPISEEQRAHLLRMAISFEQTADSVEACDRLRVKMEKVTGNGTL